MRAQLLKYLSDIRGSYWFIPSLMSIAAIMMSFLMTTIDNYVGVEWLRDIGWLYANQPAGARAVLSTIAGSMITVAGVTFSMTIVAVSFATGHLGPRLMSNFMRDRSNQITLGTFIGTFIYCLLVLRTVRDSYDQTSQSINTVTAFVPHLAILFALLFAIVSVAVLIYFIHHIPESINVSKLTANVGKEMNAMIDELFPVQMEEPLDNDTSAQMNNSIPDNFYTAAVPIQSKYNGYIQVLDESALMKIASDNDLVIRVEYRPGDFVTVGKTLLLAWPLEQVNDEVVYNCRNVFAFGIKRTHEQNILFLVDQLVEIIARALSPGINDPFTAISCIDWFQAMLSKLVMRDCPSAYRSDESGKLRVIVHPLSFKRATSMIFDQIRPYVCSDKLVMHRINKMLADIIIELPPESDRVSLLLEHAKILNESALESLKVSADRDEIQTQYELIKQLIDNEELKDQLRDNCSWLDGTA